MREIDKQLFDVVTRNDNNVLTQVQELIKQGAIPSTLNTRNQTLLHIAAKKGNDTLLAYLLDCIFTINSQDALGNTALHYAVMKNHLACATLLIEKVADPTMVNQAMSPQSLACTSEMVLLLINSQHNPLSSSVPSPMLCEASTSTQCERTPTETDEEQFFCAIIDDDSDVFNDLIGEININCTNAFGETPLHVAFFYQRIVFVHALLVANANVNIVDQNGNTPLDYVKIRLSELSALSKLLERRKEHQQAESTNIACPKAKRVQPLPQLSLSESLNERLSTSLGLIQPLSPREYLPPRKQ